MIKYVLSGMKKRGETWKKKEGDASSLKLRDAVEPGRGGGSDLCQGRPRVKS